MSQEYVRAIGRQMRAFRAKQGLTLIDVEKMSNGRWKAVVVGSYERGDRAITAARLLELAEFYGISARELLPDVPASRSDENNPPLSLDLTALARLPRQQAGP